MSSPYSTIINGVLKGGPRLSFTMEPPGFRVPMSLVGYSSNRWLRYVDDYLEGGIPFRDFLAQPVERGRSITYRTEGTSNHTAGACILSITRTRELVHVSSRVIDLAGAGVLDFNLVWLLCITLKLPVWLTCPLAKFNEWQLAGYKDLDNLVMCPLVKKAYDFRDKDPSQVKFARAARKLKSLDIPASEDEEDVVRNFVRITPEDLGYHLGLGGRRLRNVLRDEFGTSIKGEARYTHSWASYEDPRFLKLRDRMGIKDLPPLEDLVRERIRRRGIAIEEE